MMNDDELIDNAAACAQFRPLCSDMEETDESLRECIKLNVCKPLRSSIAELEAVLCLLRAHRNGGDTWNQPIPSDLLDRESALIGYCSEDDERAMNP